MNKIQFSCDAIHVNCQEKHSGNKVELQGALTPASD